MRCHTVRQLASYFFLVFLACQFSTAQTIPPFEPGPIEPLRLTAAAGQAGFKVRRLKTDVPFSVRPRLPFVTSDYNDESLNFLRRQYPLEKVASVGQDEWQSQLL